MLIKMWPQELELVQKAAHIYAEKTGEDYSTKYIVTLLTEKYEKDLEKDLKSVMNFKLRQFEERQAEKGNPDLFQSNNT